MRTLKLQLDYVLARNIPQSDIRKSRAVWDVAFDSDHRPVLLSFMIRFHKRNRGVPLQPEIDMAGLKDDECRRKFRQRVSIHVGVRTRKKLSDADSFTKCIQDAARETLPVLLPRKKFVFASAETKSTYNSVCVARSGGDFNQEKRLRRKVRRQLQQDRDNEWTSRAMEFEKVRPADRLVQRVLKSSSGSNWKKPPGRKRKFWTEAVKEDPRTLGVDRQYRRDVRFRRIWNSDEWIDSVQALAEDREGWAELCSRTAHLGEDAGNRVRRRPPVKSRLLQAIAAVCDGPTSVPVTVASTVPFQVRTQMNRNYTRGSFRFNPTIPHMLFQLCQTRSASLKHFDKKACMDELVITKLFEWAEPHQLHTDTQHTKRTHTAIAPMRALIIAVSIGLIFAAPIQDADSVQEKLKALQEQLNTLQKQLVVPASSQNEDARKFLFNDWQPQKRMVAWQPMKRNLDERQPLLHAIEARLSEVLRAGERLGVSPEEVLQDLRYRNQFKK
ncbi:hypothetical protein RB195_004629 [Necator americanus]|uniref:Endonuclease/exonuclease/phosphatase domain-containing protein n=1 Tax=Necator americanus TaxID=51031 RepID=A0ABR1BIZ0_NECAM